MYILNHKRFPRVCPLTSREQHLVYRFLIKESLGAFHMGCHAQDGLYTEYQHVQKRPLLEPINLQEVFASPS